MSFMSNPDDDYGTLGKPNAQPNTGGFGRSGIPDNAMVFPTGEEVKPYSGLPESYRDQLLSFLMPQLQSGIENMSGNIDDYTQNALGTYRQEFNQFINDAISKQIRNLSKRGILDSSMAEKDRKSVV